MTQFKIVVKWIGFAAVFVALFAFTLIANQKRSKEVVNRVIVEFSDQKVDFITEDDILRLFPNADSSNFGMTSQVELQNIENELMKNSYVDNCQAFINNSEQLTIKVRQKEPLFRVIHQNGVSYYVDKSGEKFPVSARFTSNVPIATGRIVYQVDSLGVQRGQAVNDLMTFFEFVSKDEVLQSLVTRVDVRPSGDLVFTPRTGKHIVNIGKPVNLKDKFHRLIIFYQEALNKIGWDEYQEVSVKFENQIIAKKK